MTEKLIAAVTPHESPYPPYLNVTDVGDGTVRIILRGNVRGDVMGATVTATMSMEAWHDFRRQVCDGPDHVASGTYREVIR